MLAADSTLGPYRIRSLLGAGGMGEVYRAHDPRLGRDVAVKILASHLGNDGDAVERLTREARVVAALSHSGILTIHDVGWEHGRIYLVTELLDGETLRQRLARGPLPWTQALDVARAIADALSAAHSRGIVHRDLKPENVFLTASGAVKLLDFGVAKIVATPDDDTRASAQEMVTAAGTTVGTVAYMAPEQLEGRHVDHRADQFAFGVVLHEMLSGRRPFTGETPHEIAASILRDPPGSLDDVRPPLPPGLSRIVHHCLARDPARRYAATSDLTLALDEVRADAKGMARTPRTGRQSGRRALAWTLAAAAAAAAGFTVWNLAPSRDVVPAQSTPGSRAPARLVAVLPFSTIGNADAYVADGITEAVTRELGRVTSIRVVAPNTAFAYRDKADALGRELGVGLLVQGSVQQAGDRVRINAALVETAASAALWTDRYDRASANVLAVQDDIAWQIALRLAQLTGSPPPERPSQAGHTNAVAYDAYLRGLSHMKGRSAPSGSGDRLVAAIAEFERSVTADPEFALGHAMLASAYTQQFFYNAADPSFEQKAFLEIEKSLALNPDQAEAYLARAQIVWNVRNGFQHERAVRDLQRAVASYPSLAEAYVELGKVYYHIGLLDKAIAANDEAVRLDPLAAVAMRRRFSALVDARRFDEVREALARNPRWLGGTGRAEAFLAMGDAEAALAALQAGAAGQGDRGFRDTEPTTVAVLAQTYAKLGRRGDAERVLAAGIPLVVNPTGLSDMHHAQFAIGCAYALLGRRDEAVQWLTRAADQGLPSYPLFSTHVDVVVLKGHPPFDALVERLRGDWERWRATL